MKHFMVGIFFSVAVFGCHQGATNSEKSNELAQNNARNVDLSCESYGAKLVVVRDGDKYTATVSGKAAELMRDERGKTVLATGGGYDAGIKIERKKEFPRHWALSHNFDKPLEAPKVIVKGLSKIDFGYTSDQHGPVIMKEQTGHKLVITFFELTGSHTSVSYEYANWFFADKDCK